jgi:hypothetical protein
MKSLPIISASTDSNSLNGETTSEIHIFAMIVITKTRHENASSCSMSDVAPHRISQA